MLAAWDMKSGKRMRFLEVEDVQSTADFQMAAADESTVIVSDGSGKLRRYDFVRGAFGEDLEPTAKGNNQPSPIVFSPDHSRFAVGVPAVEEGGYGVRIHEWPSGKVLHTFRGHASQITALTFSADGKRLASGSYDATVLVWDMAAAKVRD